MNDERSSPIAIGERICALRKNRELTQAALAKLCGISQQTIGSLETGRVSDPRHLPIIGQMLNVSVEFLRYGRSKGVPIILNTASNASLPRAGEDLDPAAKMLPTMQKYSQRAFAFITDDTSCRSVGVFPGDLVVVDPEVETRAENLVCVRYQGRLSLRIIKDMGSSKLYAATNDNHATLDDSSCEFVGTVIQITRLITN